MFAGFGGDLRGVVTVAAAFGLDAEGVLVVVLDVLFVALDAVDARLLVRVVALAITRHLIVFNLETT